MDLRLTERKRKPAVAKKASKGTRGAAGVVQRPGPVLAAKAMQGTVLEFEGFANRLSGGMDPTQSVKLAVVITHHNYSHLVGRAIDSVLGQTHELIELIIVDDASDEGHRRRLEQLVEAAEDPRIRLVTLNDNVGQTAAMLLGLDHTEAEFVCYLDPDDYFEPQFAETMLRAHLNPRKPASVVACEMGLYKVGGGVVALSQTGFIDKAVAEGRYEEIKWSFSQFGFSQYFPAVSTGWIWGATSSLVFRRDTLEFLRLRGPTEPALRRICGDGFLVYGAHMLGGTLFVHQTLSWRGIHTANAVLPSRFVGGEQSLTRRAWSDEAARDFFLTNHERSRAFIIQTLLRNGAAEYFQPSQLGEVFSTHLNSKELAKLCEEDEALKELMWKYGSNARL